MIATLILAVGLVLVIEGLVLALAPRRIEDALALLASLAPETRRIIGLGALALGVMVVALARVLGA